MGECLEDYYCENCWEENLKSYVIDHLGSVFCNEKCADNSLEYRDIKKIKIVTIKN